MSGPTHSAYRKEGIISVHQYDRGRGRMALKRAEALAEYGERIELIGVSEYGLYKFRAVSIVDIAQEAHPGISPKAVFPAADGMSAVVKIKDTMHLIGPDGAILKTYKESKK